jgi:hypothetical protein
VNFSFSTFDCGHRPLFYYKCCCVNLFYEWGVVDSHYLADKQVTMLVYHSIDHVRGIRIFFTFYLNLFRMHLHRFVRNLEELTEQIRCVNVAKGVFCFRRNSASIADLMMI